MRASVAAAAGTVVVAAISTLAVAQATPPRPSANCANQSIAISPISFGGPGSVVIGPVSLGAANYAHTDVTAARPAYLKTGALVLRGHTVTMKIAQTPPRTTGFIGMPEGRGTYALADSKAEVTLTACGRHQRTSRARDGRGVTFWSGGFVKPAAPVCVPIDVYVDHSRRSRRIVLSFGAGDCPTAP